MINFEDSILTNDVFSNISTDYLFSFKNNISEFFFKISKLTLNQPRYYRNGHAVDGPLAGAGSLWP
jgi:hypothetical protein